MSAAAPGIPPSASPARRLTAPFFEVGPKNLLRLPEIIELAHAAAAAGSAHDVSIIFTVPAPLIAPVRAAEPGVFVFAQAMDAGDMGPSVGRVIAESLVDADAHGVMLNHDDNPLEAAELHRAVSRANENRLLTMVCAGTDAEVMDILSLAPAIVLYEPPALIGGAGEADRPWIGAIDARVRTVAPEVLMMHAGGVSGPDDAYRIMRAGSAGTGSTSGVLRDASPSDAVARFIEATRRGFDDARS